jgi:hypothetical protein
MNKASTKKATAKKMADLKVHNGTEVIGGAPLTYKLVYNKAS